LHNLNYKTKISHSQREGRFFYIMPIPMMPIMMIKKSTKKITNKIIDGIKIVKKAIQFEI